MDSDSMIQLLITTMRSALAQQNHMRKMAILADLAKIAENNLPITFPEKLDSRVELDTCHSAKEIAAATWELYLALEEGLGTRPDGA